MSRIGGSWPGANYLTSVRVVAWAVVRTSDGKIMSVWEHEPEAQLFATTAGLAGEYRHVLLQGTYQP